MCETKSGHNRKRKGKVKQSTMKNRNEFVEEGKEKVRKYVREKIKKKKGLIWFINLMAY